MSNTTQRLRAGDPAPNVELIDSEGTAVSLRDWWIKGPVVITFLRHFG